jgi:hypothetical protein
MVNVPEKDPEIANGKKLISDNLVEIKEDAANAITAVQDALNQTRESMVKNNENKPMISRKQEKPQKDIHEQTVRQPNELKTAALDPLDSEDRKLTEELLREALPNTGLMAEKPGNAVEAPGWHSQEPVTKHREPLDLKRIAKIRDLYLDTMDILDCR